MLAIASLLLASCQEIPQDAPKPFAANSGVKSAPGAADALAARARTQDENTRFRGEGATH
jgi:hypothetical protein